MTPETAAEVVLISASAHHERLCEAYDRGENVTVALGLAHTHLVRAKQALAELLNDRKASK